MKRAGLLLGLVLVLLTFQGCVRFTGGAGYWHTGSEGEAQGKAVGFDTNNLVPGSRTPGSIN